MHVWWTVEDRRVETGVLGFGRSRRSAVTSHAGQMRDRLAAATKNVNALHSAAAPLKLTHKHHYAQHLPRRHRVLFIA